MKVSETWEFFKCILVGKCEETIYEYTFLYEGKEYVTDDCFSNFYGASYCTFENVCYPNVPYSSKKIGTEVIHSDFCLVNGLTITVLVINILFRLIRDFIFKKAIGKK